MAPVTHPVTQPRPGPPGPTGHKLAKARSHPIPMTQQDAPPPPVDRRSKSLRRGVDDSLFPPGEPSLYPHTVKMTPHSPARPAVTPPVAAARSPRSAESFAESAPTRPPRKTSATLPHDFTLPLPEVG